MTAQQNKQVVLDFYQAGARGDMATCFKLVADDIVWTNIGNTKFSGTFRGKQDLTENLLGPLFSQLQAGIQTSVEQVIAEGNIVIAQTTGSAITHQGLAYNNSYCQVFEIRDGQIKSVKEYFDTALVDSVFGHK